MKLLAEAAKKFLLIFGYPKLETTHPELGIYSVGALRTRLDADVPACQFFYPVGNATIGDDADDASSSSKDGGGGGRSVPYCRPAAVEGLVYCLNGLGDGILQFLGETDHPLGDTYGADPLSACPSTKERFPLVVFSHGLTGSMEMYTELCAQIASTGCVVVAIEHQDGTAAYAETADGKVIRYDKPVPNDEIPYSRQKVVNHRMPMLEKRVVELQRLYDRLVATAENDADRRNIGGGGLNGHEDEILRFAGGGLSGGRGGGEGKVEEDRERELIRRIVSSADPQRLHLVGHSFGGATQLLAAQTWFRKARSAARRATTKTMIAEEAAVDGKEATTADRPAFLPRRDPETPSERDETENDTATATATATAVAEPPPNDDVPSLPVPRSITVFDPWSFAMDDSAVEAGLFPGVDDVGEEENDYDASSSLPSKPLEVLSVMAEETAFHNPEREPNQEFLRNSRGPLARIRSSYAPNAVHQSLTDSHAWLPSVAAIRFGTRGLGEARHETVRALVREVHRFATSGGNTSAATLSDDDDSTTLLKEYPLSWGLETRKPGDGGRGKRVAHQQQQILQQQKEQAAGVVDRIIADCDVEQR